MIELHKQRRETADPRVESICPLCRATLAGDRVATGIEARCPNCDEALWCRVRLLDHAIVLDMMPSQTFHCDLSHHLARFPLPLSKCPHMLVNLASVQWADSTFLAGLIQLKKRAAAYSGRLILFAPSPLLQEMLAQTHLGEFFAVVARESDALQLLSEQHSAESREGRVADHPTNSVRRGSG